MTQAGRDSGKLGLLRLPNSKHSLARVSRGSMPSSVPKHVLIALPSPASHAAASIKRYYWDLTVGIPIPIPENKTNEYSMVA